MPSLFVDTIVTFSTNNPLFTLKVGLVLLHPMITMSDTKIIIINTFILFYYTANKPRRKGLNALKEDLGLEIFNKVVLKEDLRLYGY